MSHPAQGWDEVECAIMDMPKKGMPHKPDKAMMKKHAAEVAKKGAEKKNSDDKKKKPGKKLPPWLMYDENGKVVPKKKGKK